MLWLHTFEDVAAAYSAALATPGGAALQGRHDDPRAELLEFLGAGDDEEMTLRDDVRVVLVAADFGTELPAAVLWLNMFDHMDIRCVRLRPYTIDGRVLVDVPAAPPGRSRWRGVPRWRGP